ncbi:MAG: hydrogen peroxide-dependent heme synthase [Candidatus Korobacteraceae bacterium]
MTELPALPLTIEGASVLHQMFRIRWAAWNRLSAAEQAEIIAEAGSTLAGLEGSGQTALFSVLGHKGDLLILHFRDSVDELNRAELCLSGLRLQDYLRQTSSYLSVVELGLYESTVKLYRECASGNLAPHSEEWNRAVEDLLARQRQAMRPRLFPKIPATRYLCFYPMDRRRGESKNWYTLPIEERQRQMDEHGTVGRRYAGRVQQIISGSIGYDDWEWAVDLFGNDPVVFKKLIYEMRFDEVSAVYSDFGTFYLGVRFPANGLGQLMGGELPAAG